MPVQEKKITPENRPIELSPTQITAYASSLILSEWIENGQAMMSGYLGKVDDLLQNTTGLEVVGKKTFAETKPRIEAFVSSWLEHSGTDRRATSEAIFSAIEKEGGPASEGLKEFRQLLKGEHKLDLQGSNASSLNQIIQSEKIPEFDRAKVLLDISARELARSDSSPRAAKEIAGLFRHDGYHGDYANSVALRPSQASNVSTSPLDLLTVVPELGAIVAKPATIAGKGLLTLPQKMGEHYAKGVTSKLAAAELYSTGYATTATALGHLGVLALAVGADGGQKTVPSQTSAGARDVIARDYFLEKDEAEKKALAYLTQKYLSPSGQEKPGPFDFGSFFLSQERSADSLSSTATTLKALKEFREKVSAVVKPKSEFYEKLSALRGSVFEDISFYNRERAGISDAFSGEGTNCSGRTKLMIDALKAAKLEAPEGMRYGVQRYRDHIEPVLYDERRKTAVGLLDAESRGPEDSPIYDPDFLIQMSLDSIENDKDLAAKMLIAGSNLPRGGSDYRLSEIPEFAVNFPRSITADWQTKAPRHNPGAEDELNTSSEKATVASPQQKKVMAGAEFGFMEYETEVKGKRGTGVELVFADHAKATAFNSLSTRDERSSYLIGHFRKSVRQFVDEYRTSLKQIMEAQSDPSLLKNLTDQDMERVQNFLTGFQLENGVVLSLVQGSNTSANSEFVTRVLAKGLLQDFNKSINDFQKKLPDNLPSVLSSIGENGEPLKLLKLLQTSREAFDVEDYLTKEAVARAAEHFEITEVQNGDQSTSHSKGPVNSQGGKSAAEMPLGLELPQGVPGDSPELPRSTSGKFSAYLVIEGEVRNNAQEKKPLPADLFSRFFVHDNFEAWIRGADFSKNVEKLKAALTVMSSEDLHDVVLDVAESISPEFVAGKPVPELQVGRNLPILRRTIQEILAERGETLKASD